MGMGANDYTRACEAFHQAKNLFQIFLQSGCEDEEALLGLQDSVPMGLYEHWRSKNYGPKFYVVYGAGIEQDVHTPLVAYTALYEPHAGMLTFRHLLDEARGFLSPIDHEIFQGARFRFVESLNRKEIYTLLEHVDKLSFIKNTVNFRLCVNELTGKHIDPFN